VLFLAHFLFVVHGACDASPTERLELLLTAVGSSRKVDSEPSAVINMLDNE